MKTKTKVASLILIPVVLSLVMVTGLIWVQKEIRRADLVGRLANEIVHKAFELDQVVSQELLYPEERPKAQFRSIYDSLKDTMDRFPTETASEGLSLRKMIGNTEDIGFLFPLTIFQDVTHRVRSMALVHEKLYQSTDLARAEFSEYTRSLLNYLCRAYGTEASGIRLNQDLEPVSLSVNTAVPFGLILNELVINALKHAFRGRAGGEVVVSLRGRAPGRVCLCVRDNGTGLPAGFDWRQTRSLGLRLVQMLAGQLHAAVEVSRDGGTEFKITFEVQEQGNVDKGYA